MRTSSGVVAAWIGRVLEGDERRRLVDVLRAAPRGKRVRAAAEGSTDDAEGTAAECERCPRNAEHGAEAPPPGKRPRLVRSPPSSATSTAEAVATVPDALSITPPDLSTEWPQVALRISARQVAAGCRRVADVPAADADADGALAGSAVHRGVSGVHHSGARPPRRARAAEQGSGASAGLRGHAADDARGVSASAGSLFAGWQARQSIARRYRSPLRLSRVMVARPLRRRSGATGLSGGGTAVAAAVAAYAAGGSAGANDRASARRRQRCGQTQSHHRGDAGAGAPGAGASLRVCVQTVRMLCERLRDPARTDVAQYIAPLLRIPFGSLEARSRKMAEAEATVATTAPAPTSRKVRARRQHAQMRQWMQEAAERKRRVQQQLLREWRELDAEARPEEYAAAKREMLAAVTKA
eukprot:ctg_4650.g509